MRSYWPKRDPDDDEPQPKCPNESVKLNHKLGLSIVGKLEMAIAPRADKYGTQSSTKLCSRRWFEFNLKQSERRDSFPTISVLPFDIIKWPQKSSSKVTEVSFILDLWQRKYKVTGAVPEESRAKIAIVRIWQPVIIALLYALAN